MPDKRLEKTRQAYVEAMVRVERTDSPALIEDKLKNLRHLIQEALKQP